MNITKGQLCGAIIIVLIATFFYLGRFFLQDLRPFQATFSPYAEKEVGSVAVALTGNTDRKGIYFVSPETTISHFLGIAEVTGVDKLDEKILSLALLGGEEVIIESGQIRIGSIDAAKRITLDIPININNSTVYDLSLIPGIGKKTAEAIVALRDKTGRISHIDDLLNMHGMNKKRLTKIKRYLTVNGRI